MTLARLSRGVLLLVLAAGAASAQTYPSKSIRFVVGGIGGDGDITARMIAQGIAGPLGQPVIVENRPGAQGETVAKAPPDGYTLLLSAGNQIWLVPLLRKIAYDPVKDLTPITMTDRDALLLLVHPSLPVKSVKDLIALAKARPGDLNYGSTGAGSTGHLAMELLKSMANIDLVHIPYKSASTRIAALIGGEIETTFGSPSPMMPLVKSGKLRALGITTPEPSALASGIPTLAAAGVPGYVAIGITAIFAPAKTPAPVISRLNQEIVRFLSRPEVKQSFFERGSEPITSSPEQLAAAMEADMARNAKLIKDLGLRSE